MVCHQYLTITKSEIKNNACSGILIQSDSIKVSNNNIHGNASGIHIDATFDDIINNLVHHNDTGITVN